MKKIGIITHYYRSLNYGGVLQAYALCRCLRDQGYDCEQICYDTSTNSSRKHPLKTRIARVLATVLFERNWKKRRRVLAKFREQIPHSEIVYTNETISQSVDKYDVFVTGSDQVWNLKAYHSAYFLDFVPSEKRKLSYAASLCTDCLEEFEKALFQNSLRDFYAVSVREKNSIDVLTPLIPQPVIGVADPVFLLTSAQWDELCGDRVVKDEYIFCYFLGNDRRARELAKQYAKVKHMKLVTMPYIHQHISKSMSADFGFGDIKIHDASPEQFVSLIKYADVIFTDSFHAVAFSALYEKDFFVFERANESKMSSRIYSIVEMMGAEERFCAGEHRNLDYLINCKAIDYRKNHTHVESLKANSLNYLIDNIG